ncbi:MAG TPA: CBS domain-containing protein [Thermoanaerobaculia bacterium]|nr:CBS domain-containing protein [Thermoanaerobaculia bacterium]
MIGESAAGAASGETKPGIFVYFSDLLSRTVVDAQGSPIGRLWDLSIRLPEPYPPVSQLLIRPPGQADLLLVADGAQVRAWTENPIPLSARLPELRPSRRRDKTEILLREALLDKQVVDVSGAKVERVNDLHFLIAREGQLVLAHIDVGLRGLVRRLGWERGLEAVVRAVRPGARFLTQDEGLIGWKYVLPTLADPAGLRLAFSQKSIGRLHPADLAEILEDLPASSRRTVFDALEFQTAARVLPEVDPTMQQDLLPAESDPERAADLLEKMPPDAAADVLGELSEENARDLIDRMQPEDAKAVTALLGHEEDTAGGLMTTDLVTFSGSMTVGDAFARLREIAHDVEFLYQFYVVDEQRRLVGIINMRRLFLGKETDRLSDVMAPWTIRVHPEDPASHVAEVIEKYNQAAVPVVDGDGVLVGMITVDDVLTEVLPLAWKKKLRL